MLTIETDTGRGRGTPAVGTVGASGMRGRAGAGGAVLGLGRSAAVDGGLRVVPRRSRCNGRGATYLLLPVSLRLRRADTAAVIGGGARGEGSLVAATTGIAERLGRPPATVRGWLRRFAGRVEAGPGGVHPVALAALAPDPVLPGPAGSGWADAVGAVSAAAGAFAACRVPKLGYGADLRL